MSSIERTIFLNPRGQSLAAVIHRPPVETTDAAVVVAHGMLSSKDSPKHMTICERAAGLGALALRFDFTGRGQSEGDPELLTVSREVEDLRAALTLVRRLGAERVVVVGSSLGGAVAILVAAGDRGLAGLATISSPAHLPVRPRHAWTGAQHEDRVEVAPGVFIHSDFFTDAVRHDVVDAAGQVRCPWLVIHGACDEVVPPADASDLATANPPARLLLHPEADHRFSTDPWREWLLGRIAGFVGEVVEGGLKVEG